jgi:hypothetical protein
MQALAEAQRRYDELRATSEAEGVLDAMDVGIRHTAKTVVRWWKGLWD